MRRRGAQVLLFTRNGNPVHGMYTDIVASLQKPFASVACKGYVLDGELIVVDSDGAPMPWCNGKWRFDSSASVPVQDVREVRPFRAASAHSLSAAQFTPARDCRTQRWCRASWTAPRRSRTTRTKTPASSRAR